MMTTRTKLRGAVQCGDAPNAGIAIGKEKRGLVHPAWVKQQLLHDLGEA
jgi:hypothetical protein